MHGHLKGSSGLNRLADLIINLLSLSFDTR